MTSTCPLSAGKPALQQAPSQTSGVGSGCGQCRAARAPTVAAANAASAAGIGVKSIQPASQAATAALADAGKSTRRLAQAKPPSQVTETGGALRMRSQTRRKTSVPLVPPKPKLFFTATSIFISRAVFAQ